SKIAKVQAPHQSLSHRLVDRIRQKYRQPATNRRLKTDLLGQAKSSYCTEPISATSFLNFRNLNVYVVGEVGHPKAKVVRIVHISDTRGTHTAQSEQIPQGQILIHSGDFVSCPPSRGPRLPIWCQRFGYRLARLFGARRHPKASNWRHQVEELNQFFARQPHDYKIFIPGCWENWRPDSSHHPDPPTPEKIQAILKSAIYLEDAWCRVLGLTIYGTSWTAADDLRPEDGAFAGPHLDRLLRFGRRTRPSGTDVPTESVASPLTDVPSMLSTASVLPDHHPPAPSFTDVHARGFVLSDIVDVAERWKYIPDCADIVVTHMPAWRPELFTHIAERVNPTLHLCGHDFTGYGVMWKRGTLFSNAALQLTSTFPPTGYPKADSTTVSTSTMTRHPGRRRTRSRTVSHETKPNSQTTQTTGESLPPPSLFSDSFELRGGIREPPLYTKKPNGRPRPPRWQRRLPYSISRLFFGSGRTDGNGGDRDTGVTRDHGCAANWSALFRRRWRPQPAVFISETQSSRAAAEHAGADLGFIYDPDMRAGIGAMAIADSVGGSGSGGAGYSGGSTGLTGSTLCSSVCRRNPIVIDVYVVSDDPNLVILPPYAHPTDPSSSSVITQQVCHSASLTTLPQSVTGPGNTEHAELST
ncbi:hypothetical protein FBUS_01637, partial [Fasciolopsis buskii]